MSTVDMISCDFVSLHMQFYLRQWSLQLDVPIVSVDYSLAPEAPFPRALEECVMAYAWVLLNKERLGTCLVQCGGCSSYKLSSTVVVSCRDLVKGRHAQLR